MARHPTARFDVRSALLSQAAAPNGRPCYDLIGTFTLHGVGRPATIRAKAETVGQIVRLSGGFAIRQTDFGIKPFAKFGGVVGVADELRIYGDIRLPANPPTAVSQPPVSMAPASELAPAR